MDSFEKEIISGILDGRITDINSFMITHGELQGCEPQSLGSAQLKAPDDGRILILQIVKNSFVPKSFDETAIKLAQFRSLIFSLAKSGHITLATKPGSDLNSIGTICLLDTNRQLNFAFYSDNWDLLFKKILPLPSLKSLYENLTKERPGIGFKISQSD